MKAYLAQLLRNKAVLAAMLTMVAAILATFNIDMSDELRGNLLSALSYASMLLAGWLAPSPVKPAAPAQSEPPKE